MITYRKASKWFLTLGSVPNGPPSLNIETYYLDASHSTQNVRRKCLNDNTSLNFLFNNIAFIVQELNSDHNRVFFYKFLSIWIYLHLDEAPGLDFECADTL